MNKTSYQAVPRTATFDKDDEALLHVPLKSRPKSSKPRISRFVEEHSPLRSDSHKSPDADIWASSRSISFQSVYPSGEPTFPPVDKALTTRDFCLAGMVVSYAISFACIAVSIYIWFQSAKEASNPGGAHTWSIMFHMNSVARTFIGLGLAAIGTCCGEALGYVHVTSLRWALWREGRLYYNSNLRLLTFARHCAVNSWYANLASGIALVVTYAAASQMLIAVNGFHANTTRLNGVAFLIFGLSLLTQALLAQGSLYKHSTRILTWSSNPLTVTLACLKDTSHLQRRNGRCMLNVVESKEPFAEPVRPVDVQPSLRIADAGTRHIVRFIWVLLPCTLIWAITIATIGLYDVVPLSQDVIGSYFAAISFTSIFQGFATLGLHSTELLVNRSRDEFLWRRATSLKRGYGLLGRDFSSWVPRTYNSIIAAFTSWQSATLFTIKPIAHWLLGSALTVQTTEDQPYVYGVMNPPYTFGLAGATLILAVFATLLVRLKPRGFLPASWGHLQTVADLIDDWGDGSAEKLYWGDKGFGDDGVRHAGTTSDWEKIGKIQVDCVYR